MKLFPKATKKKITAYAREEVPQRPRNYPFKSHAILAVSILITYYIIRTEEFGIMMPVQYIYAQVFAGTMTLATYAAVGELVWSVNLKMRKIFYGDGRKGPRKMNDWATLALIVGISYLYYLFNCHIYGAAADDNIFVAAFIGFILIWGLVTGIGAILGVEKDYSAYSMKQGTKVWKALFLTILVAVSHIIFVVVAKEVLLTVHI